MRESELSAVLVSQLSSLSQLCEALEVEHDAAEVAERRALAFYQRGLPGLPEGVRFQRGSLPHLGAYQLFALAKGYREQLERQLDTCAATYALSADGMLRAAVAGESLTEQHIQRSPEFRHGRQEVADWVRKALPEHTQIRDAEVDAELAVAHRRVLEALEAVETVAEARLKRYLEESAEPDDLPIAELRASWFPAALRAYGDCCRDALEQVLRARAGCPDAQPLRRTPRWARTRFPAWPRSSLRRSYVATGFGLDDEDA
ncbi:hypothetical protein C3Y87_11925 [Carbonactinospora thermoautotrophica]|uniref:Uncharacterized protein n=1 Tax=Carbonactinospora thermoautotrophica TaxID=1469144 RepID=A0A132N6U3_9ACTN|nr:hypothetical protein [Carbonactinospora thermoautotrophica]KWX01321.1 hypothetical protein LI90_2349 [Carbonactinospora thermoautotrophica]KWX05720.1 hypothetical protein TH66_01370 [Carbonactinospora thermoautotrophica]KWX09878.1 hypothetical protein TR74_06995 [Carbonactinospora thermoautotrophica]MCX9192108.1 hypothetical protein [Carbonactinospora thermoautotrophica]